MADLTKLEEAALRIYPVIAAGGDCSFEEAARACVAVAAALLDQCGIQEKSTTKGATIVGLRLSTRSRNVLQDAGITTIAELIGRTPFDLLELRNAGQTSVNEIRNKLAVVGLSLKEDP